MTWNGIDLSAIIAALATVVTALLGWVATSIKKRQEAAAAESRAQTALLKLTAIAVAMAGRLWDSLAPKIQMALADGNLSSTERKEIVDMVQAMSKDFVSEDELQKIASAIGLPLPGIFAKIAAFIIDRVTQAHDPDLPNTSSPAMFPIDSNHDYTSNG